MISVLTNAYNDKEVTTAMCVFDEMEEYFCTVYCNNGKCDSCTVKHLCYDIVHAREYLEKLHDERGVNNG